MLLSLLLSSPFPSLSDYNALSSSPSSPQFKSPPCDCDTTAILARHRRHSEYITCTLDIAIRIRTSASHIYPTYLYLIHPDSITHTQLCSHQQTLFLVLVYSSYISVKKQKERKEEDLKDGKNTPLTFGPIRLRNCIPRSSPYHITLSHPVAAAFASDLEFCRLHFSSLRKREKKNQKSPHPLRARLSHFSIAISDDSIPRLSTRVCSPIHTAELPTWASPIRSSQLIPCHHTPPPDK